MQCFLCQQNNLKLTYRLKTKEIYRCLNDGLFVSSPTNNKNHYNKIYYDHSPYPSDLAYNKSYFYDKLKKIISLTGEKNPNILDIGCGWGQFLEILQEKKINYLGIDTTEEAIKICRSKNLNCQRIDSVNLAKKQQAKYSAITCFQVIEHLTNPLPLLFSLKKLLKKNGLLLLTTPNNDTPLRKILCSCWSVYNTDSHFVFFNQKTVLNTLMQAGFNKTSAKIDKLRFLSLKYVVNRLLKLSFNLGKNVPVPTDPWGDLEVLAYEK